MQSMTFNEFQQAVKQEYPNSELWAYQGVYHFRCGINEGAFLPKENKWYFRCGSQGWGASLEEAIANERQNYEQSYKVQSYD